MNRYCKKTGVALIPWGPLAAGALTRPVSQIRGTTTRAEQIKDKMESHANDLADIEIINRVESLAKEKKCSMAQVAFAWSASKVTAPIVGISKVERLQEFVDAVKLQLKDEDIRYLEVPYLPKPVQGFQQDRASL
jgi:aryl-alcohol dehydrogenase-like predicted oxidoreductase